MMTAEKGNKVYTVDESTKAAYQAAGFDIYEDGKIIAYGKGKTVSYEDYMTLQEENKKLKGRVAELEKKLKTTEATDEAVPTAKGKKVGT